MSSATKATVSRKSAQARRAEAEWWREAEKTLVLAEGSGRHQKKGRRISLHAHVPKGMPGACNKPAAAAVAATQKRARRAGGVVTLPLKQTGCAPEAGLEPVPAEMPAPAAARAAAPRRPASPSGCPVLLPLKRRARAANGGAEFTPRPRWRRLVLACCPNSTQQPSVLQAPSFTAATQPGCQALLGDGQLPGWSARLALLLGDDPRIARELASASRRSAWLLLTDAQQVCAELRPSVRALACADAWLEREESDLAHARTLAGILAALVPLEHARRMSSAGAGKRPAAGYDARSSLAKPREMVSLWASARRCSTDRRRQILAEATSELEQARLWRVHRLLGDLASRIDAQPLPRGSMTVTLPLAERGA